MISPSTATTFDILGRPAQQSPAGVTSSAPLSVPSARWIKDIDGKLMMLWDSTDRRITAAA